MTLVLTINGRESIWLLADRRLSYVGRPPEDNACKVMFVEARDGVAILGYAGLGATGFGTEPAQWMSAVLRGRDITVEESLTVLYEAMKKHLPRHLARIPSSAGPPHHHLLATTLVNDEVRFYSVSLELSADRQRDQFRYASHRSAEAAGRAPRFAVSGTGGVHLLRNIGWTKSLLRVVRACDRLQVTPLAVADHLAKLNYKVHQSVGDRSVGPKCVVAWRHKRGGRRGGGGGHQFYNGRARDIRESSMIPAVSNGRDWNAVLNAMLPKMTGTLGVRELDQTDINEVNAALAVLPQGPDEHLR